MSEFKACFEHYTQFQCLYTLCWEGNAIMLSAVGAARSYGISMCLT